LSREYPLTQLPSFEPQRTQSAQRKKLKFCLFKNPAPGSKKTFSHKEHKDTKKKCCCLEPIPILSEKRISTRDMKGKEKTIRI